MRRVLMLLAFLAVAPVVRAGDATPVIDDWRKVGAPDLGDVLWAKGTLSPAAAERLVAAIDRACPRPGEVASRGDWLDWIVEDLRYAFLRGDGRPAPANVREPAAFERNDDRLRRIDLLGSRRSGARHLLLFRANAAWEIYNEVFDPTVIAVAIDDRGAVSDVRALVHTFGDACDSSSQSIRVEATTLRVTERHGWNGALCSGPEAEQEECCHVDEGGSYDLEIGGDGHFTDRRRARATLSGQFEDSKSGEEILIEQGDGDRLRVGYRPRAHAPWKPLKIRSADRQRGVVVAMFEKSPVTYTLTVAADGRSLVSAGSDGSRPQRFGWIPIEDRYKRRPK